MTWNDCKIIEAFKRRGLLSLDRWQTFPFMTDGSIKERGFLEVRQQSLETLKVNISTFWNLD